MLQKMTVQCPNCMEELEVDFFDVLPLNSETKKHLEKNDLFAVQCYKCGKMIHLNYDCLCIDEVNKYAIALCMDDEDQEKISHLLHEDDSIYLKRFVRNTRRLQEKVYIFDCHLDDRIIEIMKCTDTLQLMRKFGTDKKIDIYFSNNGSKHFVVVMDNQQYVLDFDQSVYDSIYRNVVITEPDDFVEIDYHWAIRFVSQNV